LTKQELVYPGSFLACEEEFMAGKNTYEEDGNVYSSTIGKATLDSGSHEANVDNASKEAKILQSGSIVIGVVSSVKKNAVLIELVEAKHNGEKRIVHNSNAALPVFNISNGFVKSVQEMFRIGDIIKARVFQVTPYGIDLETKSPELGVIKAYGIKSRKPLVLIDGKLRDPVSGDNESRKISTEYILR